MIYVTFKAYPALLYHVLKEPPNMLEIMAVMTLSDCYFMIPPATWNCD